MVARLLFVLSIALVAAVMLCHWSPDCEPIPYACQANLRALHEAVVKRKESGRPLATGDVLEDLLRSDKALAAKESVCLLGPAEDDADIREGIRAYKWVSSFTMEDLWTEKPMVLHRHPGRGFAWVVNGQMQVARISIDEANLALGANP